MAGFSTDIDTAYNFARRLKTLKGLTPYDYTCKIWTRQARKIQTQPDPSLREWAYARAYLSSQQRKLELPRWLHHYNWHRPHAGIKRKTPISRSGLDPNNLLRLHT